MEKWSDVIRELKIDVAKPVTMISANDIKRITGKEPRNMAYIDNIEKLPEVFVKEGLFPLPVTNGVYALVRGRGFHTLEDCGRPRTFEVHLPFPLETLKERRSESQHIDFAYNTGLLSHFSGIPDMRPTIRGRKYSPSFVFRVDGSPELTAQGVQYEVDSGYEGRDTVLLFEGKAKQSGQPGSFIVRQLYYPYRVWRQLVDTKTVRVFFLAALIDERTTCLWEYSFDDPEDYESIHLDRAEAFRIVEHPLNIESFLDVPVTTTIIPQANSIAKILEFPFAVSEGKRDAYSLAGHYDFDVRQSYYYGETLRALGLVSLSGGTFELTTSGEKYIHLPPLERNKYFLRLLLGLPIINEIFVAAIRSRTRGVGVNEIADIIRRNSDLGGSTPLRRARGLLSWYRWVERTLGIVKLRDRRLYLRGFESTV